jgi:hypothetical protein
MYKVFVKARTAALRQIETALGYGWPGGRAKVMASLPGLITE